MTSSAEVRGQIVDMVRRDLIGPLPEDIKPADADLQRERLREQPSWWYLTGYIAPIQDLGDERLLSDAEIQEETETEVGDLIEDEDEEIAAGGAADDDTPPEAPTTRRRFAPSSIGLTVLVPATARTVAVRVTWGDYVTEPPLSAMQLTEEGADEPEVEWLRQPRDEIVELPVPEAGKGRSVAVPDSAASGLPGGALELVAHARPFTIALPGEAPREVRALSVFLVNRRKAARRRYADVAYAFQARLEIRCDAGLVPRCDLSAYGSDDEDQRIADLHYRDEVEYAVGRNSSAGWETPGEFGVVRRAWTDPLPMAEVERVAPNEDIRDVEFGMEALAERRPETVRHWSACSRILTGANSAVGLRSMPARYLFLDEVDGYPGDVEGEGDPILLAERRSATFQRRKILLVSTPKTKGLSRIEREYEASDQRRYFVPCPHCHEQQTLELANLRWPDLTITWVRRTRYSGEWRDLVDVPLNEASEAYEIDVLDGAGQAVRTLSSTIPSIIAAALLRYAPCPATPSCGHRRPILAPHAQADVPRHRDRAQPRSRQTIPAPGPAPFSLSGDLGRGRALHLRCSVATRGWTSDEGCGPARPRRAGDGPRRDVLGSIRCFANSAGGIGLVRYVFIDRREQKPSGKAPPVPAGGG